MREYWLKPGRETLHGVLSAELAPALTVDSGDLVNIETLEADWRVSRPDSACGGAEFFSRRPGLDDGQALCGPIYVRGLMPGMALQIEIGAIETAGWGWSSVGIGDEDHLRRLGYAGKEYFQVWDIADGLCTSPGGLRVPVSPFPGILAVAPRCGRANTHIPAEHGPLPARLSRGRSLLGGRRARRAGRRGIRRHRGRVPIQKHPPAPERPARPDRKPGS